MFENLTLKKQHALLGIKACSEPIQGDFFDVLFDFRGVSVIRCEGVPVGDEEVALVVLLELDPVGQGAHVVAEVELAGGAHAA